MNSRYGAAKMFFLLAVLCAAVGAILFRYATIGTGLTVADVLNPLFMIMIPRLIPFTASILSVWFGLVYFGLEKKFSRPVSIPLALLHLVAFLLLILGHVALVRFWWPVLGEGQATNTPMPLWAGEIEFASLWMCCMAFAANIVWSIWRIPLQSKLAGGGSPSRV